MSKLNEVMARFCRNQGIEALSPDEHGEYRIVFDGENRVACFERFDQLHLLSRLEVPPAEGGREEAWLKRILKHGLRRMKDSPCTPALLEDGGLSVFTRLPMADLDAMVLEELIEAHVNALEGYRRSLANAAVPTRFSGPSQMILRP